MRTIAAIMLCAVAAFFVSASVDTTSEAKKVKPAHVTKNVGKQLGKTVRKTGKSMSKAAKRGVDGVWIGTGLGAGHAAVTNNCNYYYKRYRETGDPNWRNKYNACIR